MVNSPKISNGVNNNNGKRKLITNILLWTFLANLIIGSLFYIAWSLVDMQQEIRALKVERNGLIERLEEIAAYKEQNGHFQADFSKVLEELIQSLENR